MSPSKLTIEAWPISDAGQPGSTNDDAVLVHIPEDERERRYAGSLYIVADGSGNAEQAALASQYAAERIAHDYYTSDEPDLGLRLRTAIEKANSELYDYAKTRPELVKLSTTVTAAIIRGEQLHVANVGDSRAYLVRDGSIERLTRDHTLVQQLIEEGAITPDEAEDHPRAEVVLRTLGAEPTVQVDVFDVRLKADDVFLLATDGLTRRVPDEEILRVLSTQSPRNAADSLIQRARLKGGDENTSVVAGLVRDGAPPMTGALPYAWDGSAPQFGERKTLPGTPAQGTPAPQIEEPPVPSDATQANTSTGELTQRNPVPPADDIPPAAPPERPPTQQGTAPAYQQQQQPAPEFQQQQQPPQRPQRPPAPTQQGQQPQYQPPGDYQPYGGGVDPVTGLPPTPQGGQQPPQQAPPQYQQQAPQYAASGPPQYGPRGYNPQQQPQQRGVPLGVFLAFGLFAILITVALVVLLVTGAGDNLIAGLAGGGGDETATVEVTEDAGGVAGTDDGTAPTDIVEPTDAPELDTPIPTGSGEVTDGGEPAQPTDTPTESTGPPGMQLIAEGDFLRGVTDEEIDEAVRVCINEDPSENNQACIRDFFTDAQPVESVTMSGYYIDIFEVTNAQYALCVASDVCSEPGDVTFFNDAAFSNHPVVYVDWNQAVEYCGFVGKRLPTEAEWEKAARWDELLQESYVYPWGNNFQQGIANIAGARNVDGTAPVSDFENDVSPWGVRGMGGNVSEWVQDWYFPGYADQSTLNPVGPGEQPLPQALKVLRGGSFLSFQSYSRAGHRIDQDVNTQRPNIGFRCAADLGADIQTDPGGAGAAPTPTSEGAAEPDTPTATPAP